ncbi:hypothetical protein BpHYR1_021966 [Brachionus plicatilis]|uniref:Uncharacterized protein n=1 Tax=Brachionus plicatilis TaxID=10195 RepID=A0A3M7QAD0_BRAPC|nr:hypothetical protein BpHYR1_021966 [Brachionus plicatilis]
MQQNWEQKGVVKPIVGAKKSIDQDDIAESAPKLTRYELNAIKIADIGVNFSENLNKCAEKILSQQIHKLGEAKVGDTVQVPIPDK